MSLSLRQEILLDKLNSDLSILKAKLKAERGFCMNTQKMVDSQITQAQIEEVEKQIKEIQK